MALPFAVPPGGRALCRQGRVVGRVCETPEAQFCFLAGVRPPDLAAARGEQAAAVFPEMENLLLILNETGAAHIARPRLDDVVFEAYTAFCDEMSEVILQCARQGRSVAHDVTQVVEAARFLWERALDMDYGSMELVKLDEMLPVLERVAVRLRSV